MGKAREPLDRLAAVLPEPRGLLPQPLDALLELGIPGHSERVEAPGALGVVEQRRLGEVSVGSKGDRAAREARSEPSYQRAKQRQELATFPGRRQLASRSPVSASKMNRGWYMEVS